MNKYLLGIDNGGTVCKAAVFDLNGKMIKKAGISIPLSVNKNGRTERNPAEIIKKNFELVKKITSEIDGEIIAVGLSGHGKGLYLLDKSGNYLYGGIGSTDSRALEYELNWRNDGTEKKASEKTFQKVLACQPIALLRWIKDNEKDVYNRIGSVLSVNDLVGYGLTGKIVTERTEISGTGLLNLVTEEYDSELLSLFGIEEIFSALPKVILSTDIRGGVLADVAEKTGLKVGTPIVGGMFDIDACALSAGTVRAGDMCMIAGTWSINEYISPSPVSEVSMNSLYCLPGLYLAEESSACSAGNLDRMRELLKDRSYRELDEFVEETMPEDSEIYFLPFLFASNLDPYAKACLIGLDSGSSEKEVARAIYEGIVFSGYTHVERLLKGCPENPEFIRLAGGVTNSNIWTQMFADTVGIPLIVYNDVELGCKGAAIAAGISRGAFNSVTDAVRSCVGNGKIVCPDYRKTEVYRKKYTVYRQIEESLSHVWKKIRNME